MKKNISFLIKKVDIYLKPPYNLQTANSKQQTANSKSKNIHIHLTLCFG